MDCSLRKPFQGVSNIIRFNWHYYLLSALAVLLVWVISRFFVSSVSTANIVAALILVSIIVSLVVSTYIYDFSELYRLSWLDGLGNNKGEKIININAGFDETSYLLQKKFKHSELLVADFYDPDKHTEISIKRARRAYPPFPNTQQITTASLPVQDESADKIFTILSAHEIRNDEERIVFFKELYRVLKPGGKIIVAEHLRDPVNFLAFNIGFFHFHSKITWKKTFQEANLTVSKEIKITPFITAFILEKNGTAS
jgi:ubiquinone/menaquinone biosynthesis C-methylase UbiE